MMLSLRQAKSPLIVGLGEALFDCFADRSVLGGAPTNFAVHANALIAQIGGSAMPATRIGDDNLGKRFLDELCQRGVSAIGVQTDSTHPTGTVEVDVDGDGHATYRFAADVAWDHLQFSSDWKQLANECHAVAFGTLAQRAPQSREAICAFLLHARQAFRLFDVNLRQDSYSAETIDTSLRLASAAKLNDDELPAVCQMLSLDVQPIASLEAQAGALRRRYDLVWVAVTQGARGTTLCAADGQWHGEQVPRNHSCNGDSVGAGDSCSAALVVGQLLRWHPQRIVNVANQLGDYVAHQPGATPALPGELLDLVTEGESATTVGS